MHILLKAWRKSQHDICDCWAKNMLNQQDASLKLSHLPPSSLVLWWPLFREDFPVWIPVCLYVRECPIICNLQSDHPRNRQRKKYLCIIWSAKIISSWKLSPCFELITNLSATSYTFPEIGVFTVWCRGETLMRHFNYFLTNQIEVQGIDPSVCFAAAELLYIHPSRERNISRTLQGIFLKFCRNIHSGLRVNWLDFGGQRSRSLWRWVSYHNKRLEGVSSNVAKNDKHISFYVTSNLTRVY